MEWLQFHFDSLAGPVPMAAPAVGGLGGCFALAQAGRLFRCLQGDETGRKRAKSSLCGAARFMPPEKLRKLSGAPGGLIPGAESQSPTSRLVSKPLARAARTLARPRSGKTATVALNLLRPGGAGFGGPTIVVDPRGELWCVTAQRRMALGRRVLLLDPFGAVRGLQEQRPELKGLPVEFVRRNPLDFLRKGSKGVKDFGVLLDALLTPPTSQSDAARPFHDAARAIIGGYVGWVRFGPGMDGDRTLGPFRRLLRSNQDEATKLEELLGKFPDMAFGRVVEAVKRMERVGAQEAGSNLFTIAGQLQASPTELCVAALDRILDRASSPPASLGMTTSSVPGSLPFSPTSAARRDQWNRPANSIC